MELVITRTTRSRRAVVWDARRFGPGVGRLVLDWYDSSTGVREHAGRARRLPEPLSGWICGCIQFRTSR